MVIYVVFSTSQGFYKLAYDIYLHLSELVRTDRILVTHVVYCNANCPASGHSLFLPGRPLWDTSSKYSICCGVLGTPKSWCKSHQALHSTIHHKGILLGHVCGQMLCKIV